MMQTAVIFAPTSWSFQSIAGVPLMQQTVLSALRCGFDRIIVVDTRYAERLQTLFAGDMRTRGVEVLDALPALEGSAVAVIPGDCLLTVATLKRVMAMSPHDRPILFTSGRKSTVARCTPAMLAGIGLSTLTDGSPEKVWALL